MMDELIKRLEAATGADQALDKDIHEAIGNCVHRETDYWCIEDGNDFDSGLRCRACGKDTYGENTPHYTASVDSALTLLGKNCGWTVGLKLDGRFFAVVYIDEGALTSEARTAANALSAAALRARQP